MVGGAMQDDPNRRQQSHKASKASKATKRTIRTKRKRHGKQTHPPLRFGEARSSLGEGGTPARSLSPLASEYRPGHNLCFPASRTRLTTL